MFKKKNLNCCVGFYLLISHGDGRNGQWGKEQWGSLRLGKAEAGAAAAKSGGGKSSRAGLVSELLGCLGCL